MDLECDVEMKCSLVENGVSGRGFRGAVLRGDGENVIDLERDVEMESTLGVNGTSGSDGRHEVLRGAGEQITTYCAVDTKSSLVEDGMSGSGGMAEVLWGDGERGVALDSDVQMRLGLGEDTMSSLGENRASGSVGKATVEKAGNGVAPKISKVVKEFKSRSENLETRAGEVGNEVFAKKPKVSKVEHEGSRGRKEGVESGESNGKEVVDSEKSSVSECNSTLTMVDELAAGGSDCTVGVDMKKVEGNGYEIGDMVWGKVKSHPWWPGEIYNEDFALPSVLDSKKEGHVLVAFYGDSSYGWFDPAELIPFDSNFDEKSQQTGNRNFHYAVEEAVDETSRRRALGLTCKCRNTFSFRPTDVQGYFAVDVPDYDPGAVYSIGQISKARHSFQPPSVLDFLRQLALSPSSREPSDIQLIQNKATLFAYRKAVFEEFDDTYAQAFGDPPERPTPVPPNELSPTKIPARAPLSGGLVIAEALGNRKSSSRPKKSKDQVKKDQYLFKRRDDVEELKNHPRRDGELTSLQLVSEDDSDKSVSKQNLSVLHAKRQVPTDHVSVGAPVSNCALSSAYVTESDTKSYHSPSSGEAPAGYRNNLSVVPRRNLCVVPGQKKNQDFDGQDTNGSKVKVIKRPVGEIGGKKSILAEKRRKKDLLSSDAAQVHAKDAAVEGKVNSDFQGGQPRTFVKTETSSSDVSLQDTVNVELTLSEALSDLRALALDPFHSVEHRQPGIIKRVLLRFRSLVYQKSLATPLEGERPSKIVDSIRETTPVRLQPRPLIRPNDPTKGEQKRGPSNRQEEMSAKKKNKIDYIKSFSLEKKGVQKVPESVKDAAMLAVGSMPKQVGLFSAKKTVPVPSSSSKPTLLIMKFPSGETLPSVNELEARLARFGPLDHSGTRIYVKTLSCKVVYMNKADAEAACKFLNWSKDLFRCAVKCHLREVEAAGLESKPVKLQQENASRGPLPDFEKRPSAVVPSALKSRLKKPGVEERVDSSKGGKEGGASSREKLKLGGEKRIRNNSNNASFAGDRVTSSKASPFMGSFDSKNFQKGTLPPPESYVPPATTSNAQFISPSNALHRDTELAPPLQLMQQPPLLQPPHQLPPSQPPQLPPLQQPQQPPQLNKNPQQNINAGLFFVPTKPDVDIAPQFLSLLIRCNDVVNEVKDHLGYIPYHPL